MGGGCEGRRERNDFKIESYCTETGLRWCGESALTITDLGPSNAIESQPYGRGSLA
jgi:hypothetical protein